MPPALPRSSSLHKGARPAAGGPWAPTSINLDARSRAASPSGAAPSTDSDARSRSALGVTPEGRRDQCPRLDQPRPSKQHARRRPRPTTMAILRRKPGRSASSPCYAPRRIGPSWLGPTSMAGTVLSESPEGCSYCRTCSTCHPGPGRKYRRSTSSDRMRSSRDRRCRRARSFRNPRTFRLVVSSLRSRGQILQAPRTNSASSHLACRWCRRACNPRVHGSRLPHAAPACRRRTASTQIPS